MAGFSTLPRELRCKILGMVWSDNEVEIKKTSLALAMLIVRMSLILTCDIRGIANNTYYYLRTRRRHLFHVGWLDDDGTLQTTGAGFDSEINRIHTELQEVDTLFLASHGPRSMFNGDALVPLGIAHLTGTIPPMASGQHYPSQRGIIWSQMANIKLFEELDDITRIEVITFALENVEEFHFIDAFISIQSLTTLSRTMLRDVGSLARLKARELEAHATKMLREQPIHKYDLLKLAIYASQARALNWFSFRSLHL